MPDPVHFILDEPTYRRLLWKHYGDYWLMRSRWFTGVFAILIGIIALSGLITDQPLVILGVLLVLTGLHMLASRHLYINRVVKAWKQLPDSNKQTSMMIDNDTLRLDSEVAETTLTGESINKVRDFGLGFFIYLSRQHFIAVPRQAFGDDRQYYGWIDAVRTLAGPDSAKERWK